MYTLTKSTKKSWRGWHLVDIVPLVTHNVFASLHLIAHIQCAPLHNTVFSNNGWRWNDSHWKTFKLWHKVRSLPFLVSQSVTQPVAFLNFAWIVGFVKIVTWISLIVKWICQTCYKWICWSCYMDLSKLFSVFLALCQTILSWSLTMMSKHVEASALK